MEIFHQSQSESGKALPSGEEGQTSDDGVTADDSLPADGEKTAQVSQPTGGEASAQNGAAESSLPVKDNVLESETVEYV